MRQDGATVDVDLVADGDVVAQHSHVLEPGPPTHGAVPPNDGRLDPGVVLDLASGQQHAALQPDAVSHDHVRPDGHIGTDPTVFSYLGRRVDQDVAAVHEGLRRRRQQVRAFLRQRREIQTRAGQEVLGLADVHPEPVQVERVQLAVLAHGGKRLLLDRGGPELDPAQDGRVEDVQARVDPVPDELDRLLDEAVDPGRVRGSVHDDAVLGRLLHLGHHDGSFVAVAPVEVGQLLERVVADDVRVEDEEGRVVFAEYLLG